MTQKFLIPPAILWMIPSVRRYIESALRGTAATGVSSRALVAYALGVNPRLLDWNGRNAYPRDSGDYGRCMGAYERAPKILQQRMKPIMDRWKEYLGNLDHHPYSVREAPDPYPKATGVWT